MNRPLLMLAVFAALLPSCGRPQRPATSPAVALRSIDGPGLEQTLERLRGSVVVVDFWATWCGPCLQLFPHIAELQRRYGDRGLIVITVSLDDPDAPAAVQKMLARHGATTENFLSSYGVGSAAFSAFGIADGALPHIRLYDRQGKLRRTLSSGGKPITAEDVENALAELFP
jgi:thiol-disulfide isomerase/thioredoxin